jgi:PAS domain S-box-containing protein
MKNTDDMSDAENLRQKAEDLTKKTSQEVESQASKTENLRIIKELKKHQVELEMQNMELLLAKERAEVIAQRYSDLYNYAPNGYFTLSADGKIIDLNVNGEKMLHKERSSLINCQFELFISIETLPIFRKFIDKIFNEKNNENCVVILSNEGCSPICIHLTGNILSTGEKCLVTAVNISDISELPNLNEVLLSSLPYPAMYIRGKDRVILAANKIAVDLGVTIGGYCWREFGKSEFISDKEKQISEVFPQFVPNDYGIKCSFCLADKCTSSFPSQNNPEVNAFGQIWDTYWIKVGNDIFLHYSIDITDRKRVEAERKFLSAAVENSDNFVVVKDLNLRIVAANKAWLFLSGNTSIQDVLGKTDAEVFGIQSNSEQIKTYMEDDKSAQNLCQGECIVREEFITLANGKKITVITKKYPIFDNDGKLFCTGTVATDITERKQAESQLIRNLKFTETLLKSTPIPIFLKDANGFYTGCNEAFSEQTGFTNENIKGKTDMDLWEIHQAKIYQQKDLELLSNPEYQTYESQLTNKENEIRDVIFAKNVFQDENGQISGIVGTYIDITEIKLTENALRKSEQMLLTVLDHFPGVVFWKDRNSNYLGCNQEFALGAGLKNPSEIVGKNDFDLPWGDNEGLNYRADDIEVMENGKTKLHIVETQHQIDGKLIWFDTCKIPIRESNGEVIGVIGVSNDITNWKITEDALIASEEKYRTVANYTNDWEFWINQNENFLYCSPSCEKITGYKSIDFIKNPQLIFEIVFPDDLKIIQEHRHQEKMAQSINNELVFRIIRLDGEIRWIGHVCQSVFNKSGEFIGIRGSNRDITKRKETEQQLISSEHKYKLLSENITDGIFICRNGCFEYVNQAMNDIFGYDVDELDGLKLLHLVKPESQGYLEKFIISNSLFNLTKNIEIDCIKKDATTIYVELLLNYVANEKVIYGVVHDITQKRQIQQKSILKAIIQTEEKEKAHFSKELHDGLGPLLSTIKLYLQWTLRLKSIKKRNEIIYKAETIVEDALSTVKEISNKLSPHLLAHYGLSSALQSFVNKIEETSAINIVFESNLTRRIDMEIEAAIYRAMIECINNTIKYANAENIYISVNDIGSQIQINFKDNGKGFNLNETMNEQKGLGLFNLQNRIQTIGGQIDMKSEIGHGVNYQIIIPL